MLWSLVDRRSTSTEGKLMSPIVTAMLIVIVTMVTCTYALSLKLDMLIKVGQNHERRRAQATRHKWLMELGREMRKDQPEMEGSS